MSSQLAGFLPRDELQSLINELVKLGYQVVGPQVRDGAIVYQPLADIARLPQGINDAQQPGQYRLNSTHSSRMFDWANGPESLKPFLFAPREVIWRSHKSSDGSVRFERVQPENEPLAVLGVRACDLAGLRLQDQHFLQQAYPDPWYAARRRSLLLVSVNCAKPADTCFCASTGDGPAATHSYDLNLTELDAGFLVETGSPRGEALAQTLPLEAVSDQQRSDQTAQIQAAITRQHRALPVIPLKNILQANHDHPQWDDIAERCLACGNCTQVCPTCFCHSEGERVALSADKSEHVREWDSCFSAGHGYLAGFQVRPDIKSRYRQWMTHKLDYWHAQYGRSGCVGCGRCTTWCPAEIDFVQEANVLSSTEDR